MSLFEKFAIAAETEDPEAFVDFIENDLLPWVNRIKDAAAPRHRADMPFALCALDYTRRVIASIMNDEQLALAEALMESMPDFTTNVIEVDPDELAKQLMDE